MKREPKSRLILNMKTSLKCVVVGVVGLWWGTGWAAEATKLPRLVDLGADKCIPCKAMAPILADLKTNYVGQLDVEFIDVWKKPEAAKPYKIRLIPTQIFYDAKGKERFRHQGFFSKEDILAKWKELGVELKSEGRNPRTEGTPKADVTPKAEGTREAAR